MRCVGILIFDGVEVLDACGPFEVFSVASRVSARDSGQTNSPFRVFTIADSDAVRARHDLVISAHYHWSAHPRTDILIVPGGIVTAPRQNQALINWLRRTASECELVASVCTGSFLLAQAGLLDGLPATTHCEDTVELAADFPTIGVDSSVRWTEAGKIWTSAGISAGVDMSLGIIAKLIDRSLAERTARQMDYRWQIEP